MKNKKIQNLLIVVVILAVVAAAFYFFNVKPQTEFESRNAVETIDRPELGLEFGYVAGPEALSMVEPPVTGQPMEGAFIIMPSSEYVPFANGEDTDVGPTISLFVFRYGDNEMPQEVEVLDKRGKLLAWAQENQSLTGINEVIDTLEEYELDGMAGVTYTTEQAYKQDFKLFRYGDRIYMFVGQYQNEGDEMDKYFDEVLDTIRFD